MMIFEFMPLREWLLAFVVVVVVRGLLELDRIEFVLLRSTNKHTYFGQPKVRECSVHLSFCGVPII